MGKHSIGGMRSKIVPNCKADMVFRKKEFLRNKFIADSMVPRAERDCFKIDPIDVSDLVEKLAESTKTAKEPLVHGAMKYACEKCGLSWWMFLEKGLEEFGENHKPVPFTIQCPVCHGMAHDVSGICKCKTVDGGYVVLPHGESYFKNDPSKDRGVPVFGRIQEMRRLLLNND